jgi:hypothetical protein
MSFVSLVRISQQHMKACAVPIFFHFGKATKTLTDVASMLVALHRLVSHCRNDHPYRAVGQLLNLAASQPCMAHHSCELLPADRSYLVPFYLSIHDCSELTSGPQLRCWYDMVLLSLPHSSATACVAAIRMRAIAKRQSIVRSSGAILKQTKGC